MDSALNKHGSVFPSGVKTAAALPKVQNRKPAEILAVRVAKILAVRVAKILAARVAKKLAVRVTKNLAARVAKSG